MPGASFVRKKRVFGRRKRRAKKKMNVKALVRKEMNKNRSVHYNFKDFSSTALLVKSEGFGTNLVDMNDASLLTLGTSMLNRLSNKIFCTSIRLVGVLIHGAAGDIRYRVTVGHSQFSMLDTDFPNMEEGLYERRTTNQRSIKYLWDKRGVIRQLGSVSGGQLVLDWKIPVRRTFEYKEGSDALDSEKDELVVRFLSQDDVNLTFKGKIYIMFFP